MIPALQVITILATALFGIYASFVNFRDARGRVTRHGWIGLVGVIVAGVSAASLQIYSDAQEERTTHVLLRSINRSLHQLAGFSASATLRPDWQRDSFRDHLPRLYEQITRPLSSQLSTAFGSHGFVRPKEDNALYETICGIDIQLLFYRTPIPVESFHHDIRGSGEDLAIEVSNPCKWVGMPADFDAEGRVSWELDLREGRLHRLDFVVTREKVDAASLSWKTNSKITSLEDLLGSQLIVQLEGFGLPRTPRIADDRRSVQLAELLIRLPDGFVMRFDSNNLKPFKGADGLAAYSFTFPGTMDELFEATRDDRFKNLDNPPPPIWRPEISNDVSPGPSRASTTEEKA